jgi:hypothetical protein
VDEKLQAANDALAAIKPDQKVQLVASALETLKPEQYTDVLKGMLQKKPGTAETWAAELTKNVPETDKPGVAKAAVDQLSEQQKKELVQSVLGTPSEGTRNTLWLIIIVALVVVMLSSVLVLAINVFINKQPGQESRVSPEMMLSLFTSVFGFLVGLFVPSPNSAGSRQPG